MLRYKADLRSLAFMTIFVALVAVGFIWNPESWWYRIPLIIVTAQFSFFCAVITHNTVHVPMFRRRSLNKLAQIWLTLCYGHPVSAYVPGHNLSHHEYTQTPKDWMRTSKLRFKWNILNQLFFFHVVSGAITKANIQYALVMRHEKPRWFRQLLIETAVWIGTMAALVWIDWQAFLMYVLIPHHFAAWGIVGINFIQHDGCDPNHPVNHSRNVVGKWVNWWTFNNGFHGAHHMKPGVHWSKLPEYHAKHLAPTIHPALERKSLLPVLWEYFVWPGRRLTYDGKPVVFTEPEPPDEPWLPAMRRFDVSTASLGAES